MQLNRQDNEFDSCLDLANTKYQSHQEIQSIYKDIFEQDVYSKKNMGHSFSEFLSAVQNQMSIDQIKEDQSTLLKAFISYMLNQRQILENKIYMRGHGWLALFLLCFCSIKKAFYIMKEIYFFYYADILHPDQINKEDNHYSIVKHIYSVYLENFQQQKDSTTEISEKIIAFIRKNLQFQYNFFFLNQLNLSCTFQILDQLFHQRTVNIITLQIIQSQIVNIKNEQDEVMTRAIASIINLNIQTIIDGDIKKSNMNDQIYNKIQLETFQPLLLQRWNPVSKEAEKKIIQDYNKLFEMVQNQQFNCDSNKLDVAIKSYKEKQSDSQSTIEKHLQKEIQDLKNELKLAMNELQLNTEKTKIIEIEKNNMIIKYQALKKKYEMTEIEYDDVQQKIQFLNERANKRQMHYNKEYESQILSLQNQINNQNQDYKELDMLYKNQQDSFSEQLEQKDNTIKRLKQGLLILQKLRNDINIHENDKEKLQDVYEFCKNNQTLDHEQDKVSEDSEVSPQLFYSYFQPETKQFAAHSLKIKKNYQIKQEDNSTTDQSDSNNSQSEERQTFNDENIQEIEDEQNFYAFSGQLIQKQQDAPKSDQLSQNTHKKNRSCSLSNKIKQKQQSINSTDSSPAKIVHNQEQQIIDLESQQIETKIQNNIENNIQTNDKESNETHIETPLQNVKIDNQKLCKLLQSVQFKKQGENQFNTQQLMKYSSSNIKQSTSLNKIQSSQQIQENNNKLDHNQKIVYSDSYIL